MTDENSICALKSKEITGLSPDVISKKYLVKYVFYDKTLINTCGAIKP